MKLALSGFGIGFVLGVLFAPSSGKVARTQLANKIGDLILFPERKMEQKLSEAANDAEKKPAILEAR